MNDATLEALVRVGDAARKGAFLVTRDGSLLALQDAVRVLGRRDSDTDPYGLTGLVEPIRELLRKGAVVSGTSLRLGSAIYDIEFGALLFLADLPGPIAATA